MQPVNGDCQRQISNTIMRAPLPELSLARPGWGGQVGEPKSCCAIARLGRKRVFLSGKKKEIKSVRRLVI